MAIPMQEDNLHVNVLAVLVQEVLEEVRDWFVGDVATHDNMSANTTNELDSTPAQLRVVEKKRNLQATTIYTLYL